MLSRVILWCESNFLTEKNTITKLFAGERELSGVQMGAFPQQPLKMWACATKLPHT